MRDLLHDEIDKIEKLTNKAKRITIEIFEAELPAAIERNGDIVAAMVEVAQLVEEQLAELTTEAFGAGVEFAKKRSNAQ